MSKAAQVPSFPPDGAPLSVLVDFDGTISLQDVGDTLLARLVEDDAEVARLDQLYDDGRLGSRELLRWDMDVLPHDAELLRAEVSTLSLDDTFATLLDAVRAVGGAVEIVSDGVGFHVEEMLARAGLPDVPVATNHTVLGRGGDGVSFPYGHPACFVCGTCKRERVRLHREAGRAVIFVGDGTSDRFAAYHADIVFAKGSLAAWCAEQAIEFLGWEWLADVADWIASALDDGRLPGTAVDYAMWRSPRPDDAAGFICGPEVWGDGPT